MRLSVGKVHLEAVVGLSSTLGALGRVEAGYRPAERLTTFGFAEANRGGWMAGVGARLTF